MADVLTQTSSDLENGVSVISALGDDNVVRILIGNNKYRLDRTTTLTITLPSSIPADSPLTTYLIDADRSNYFDTGGSVDGFLEIVTSPAIVAGTVTLEMPPRSVYLLAFAEESLEPPPVIPANVRYYEVAASRAELGFQVDDSDVSLLATASSYGASVARVQMGWDEVEDYDTGDLALQSRWDDFLDACVTNGLKPVVLAAYGPPWTQLMTLTVTSDTAAGATTILVNENPSAIDPLYCTVHSLTGRISSRADNYGSLITARATGPNSITIASATNVALTAGQTLAIIRRRYPPPATLDPTDTSILAYVRYTEFLAQEISDRGLEGWVEIWNEPTWDSDRWEGSGNYYDNPGSLPTGWLSLKNFLLALQTETPIDGVSYVNGTSHLSWNGSLNALGVIDHDTSVVDLGTLWGDSIHPYNGAPEYAAVYWSGTSAVNLDPAWADSNYRGIPEDDAIWAANHPGETGPLCMATETNTGGASFADLETGYRWIRRRIASLWSMRVSPASVFHLTDDAGDDLDVVTLGRGDALTAMAQSVLSLGGDGSTASIPTIASVGTGDWEIMIVNVYGAQGCVSLLWQRTAAAGATEWGLVARPDPISITLAAADGYTFASALDLETGDSISVADNVFDVTDDILLIRSSLPDIASGSRRRDRRTTGGSKPHGRIRLNV